MGAMVKTFRGAARSLLRGSRARQALRPRSTATELESEPQAVWWALEALWSRPAMAWPMAVEAQDGAQRMVLLRYRQAHEGTAGGLRTTVLDAETYQSHFGDGCRSFVRWIDWRGDDLMCELTPPRAIERWEGGDTLAWQVRAFLVRLQRLANPARSAT